MPISATAKRALERMARHQRTTPRETLERLLKEAECNLTDTLDEPDAYYDSVTQ